MTDLRHLLRIKLHIEVLQRSRVHINLATVIPLCLFKLPRFKMLEFLNILLWNLKVNDRLHRLNRIIRYHNHLILLIEFVELRLLLMCFLPQVLLKPHKWFSILCLLVIRVESKFICVDFVFESSVWQHLRLVSNFEQIHRFLPF